MLTLTKGRDHSKHDTEESTDNGLRDDDEDSTELADNSLQYHQSCCPLHHAA